MKKPYPTSQLCGLLVKQGEHMKNLNFDLNFKHSAPLRNSVQLKEHFIHANFCTHGSFECRMLTL